MSEGGRGVISSSPQRSERHRTQCSNVMVCLLSCLWARSHRNTVNTYFHKTWWKEAVWVKEESITFELSGTVGPWWSVRSSKYPSKCSSKCPSSISTVVFLHLSRWWRSCYLGAGLWRRRRPKASPMPPCWRWPAFQWVTWCVSYKMTSFKSKLVCTVSVNSLSYTGAWWILWGDHIWAFPQGW